MVDATPEEEIPVVTPTPEQADPRTLVVCQDVDDVRLSSIRIKGSSIFDPTTMDNEQANDNCQPPSSSHHVIFSYLDSSKHDSHAT